MDTRYTIDAAGPYRAGTNVFIPAHTHAFGDCFAVGAGIILDNPDTFSRMKGDVRVMLSSGDVIRFTENDFSTGHVLISHSN